ncbi:MAG: hypothetical protein IJ975_04265, partial [Clostridia bacterium]|nr:hypothetical protein [Clostridia bacterium]
TKNKNLTKSKIKPKLYQGDEMNRKKIIPHGFGFIFIVILFLCFVVAGIYMIVNFFLPGEMYHSWGAFLVGVIGIALGGYQIFEFFKQGPVIFDENNNFISPEKNKKYFPAFKINCKNIVDYKIKITGFSACIEFFDINKRKTILTVIQFSKKQVYQILNEIQIRGGLQNKEIVIKFK